MQGGWRGDSGAPPPKTGVLPAAQHHSLSSVMAGRVTNTCRSHVRLLHGIKSNGRRFKHHN